MKYKPATVTVTTTKDSGAYEHRVIWADSGDPLRVVDEEYVGKVQRWHEDMFDARAGRKSLVTRIKVETKG